MFLGGQHLFPPPPPFPPVVSCSSAGSFKAFLGRDGGDLFLLLLLGVSSRSFPSLILQKVAGAKVSAEKIWGMRGISVGAGRGDFFYCFTAQPGIWVIVILQTSGRSLSG